MNKDTKKRYDKIINELEDIYNDLSENEYNSFLLAFSEWIEYNTTYKMVSKE